MNDCSQTPSGKMAVDLLLTGIIATSDDAHHVVQLENIMETVRGIIPSKIASKCPFKVHWRNSSIVMQSNFGLDRTAAEDSVDQKDDVRSSNSSSKIDCTSGWRCLYEWSESKSVSKVHLCGSVVSMWGVLPLSCRWSPKFKQNREVCDDS